MKTAPSACGLLALLFVDVGCSSLSEGSSCTQRPNVLFILVDDQSPFDLKVYDGSSALDTPNIDRLAAHGVVFDGAYHMGSWSGAVCTPSRHMIMSGRSVWHLPKNGTDDSNPLCPEDLAEHTLGVVFNRAGYDTMRTCKRGNSYGAANAQFMVRHEKTNRKGTDEDGSAWHADRVLEFLDERHGNEDADPFFIYFGFSHPHDPRWTSAELARKYGVTNEGLIKGPNPAAPKLPINWLSSHPFHHGHPELRDEVAVQGVMRKRDEGTIRNEIGRQFACVENIDTQIGRVLERLDALGELDNTIVVYTSDHGMAIGRHGLQGKQNLYEHTWRVPLIVSGPGVEAGARAQGNVYLADLMATFCELASVEEPETSEGTSFAAILRGESDVVRDTLYGVYCGGTKPGMRAVRRGNWKLIKYDVLEGEVRETQLFDLSKNPHELLAEHQRADVMRRTDYQPGPLETNLADDPAYAQVRAEMEALLLSEMKRYDDPYRLWDQE